MSNAKDRLKNIATKLAQSQGRIELAGCKVGEAIIKRRIFNEGKASNGNRIGTYSSTPGYYSREQFSKKSAFKPIGKNENKTGTVKSVPIVELKTVRKIAVSKRVSKETGKHLQASMYLERGYTQLRELNGRQTGYIDFQFSGSLFQSIQTGKSGSGYVVGFTNLSGKNSRREVAEHLEKNYNKTIFSPGVNERQLIKDAMLDELGKVIKEN
jgi:hypothetical protein